MHRYYIIITGLILFSLIIVGISFSVVGSPLTQRAIQFDQKRLEDLSSIDTNIQSFYSDRSRLPKDIAELYNYSTDTPTKDPETKKSYEYKIDKALSYKLCTTFSTDSTKDNKDQSNSRSYRYYLNNSNTKHKKGYDCIMYTVEQSSDTGITPTPELQPWHAYTLDESRLLSELSLQQNLADYYASSGAYPAALTVFANKYDGKTPVDPQTKQPYEYTPGNGSYQLCMTFTNIGRQCVGPTLDLSKKENNIDTWVSQTGIYFSIKFPYSVTYNGSYQPSPYTGNLTNIYLSKPIKGQSTTDGNPQITSVIEVEKIDTQITDLYTYARTHEGLPEKLTINNYPAYKTSVTNTNPFYPKNNSNGVSYKIFTQDNKQNIYTITAFISENDPYSAQIFNQIIKTLQLSKVSQNTIDSSLHYPNSMDSLVHFTTIFDDKSLCIGQSVPVSFQIIRAPEYRAPESIELHLFVPKNDTSSSGYTIEKNIPIVSSQDSANYIYNWTAGKTSENLQILPGENYMLGLTVTYDNTDTHLENSDKFSLINCSASKNR